MPFLFTCASLGKRPRKDNKTVVRPSSSRTTSTPNSSKGIKKNRGAVTKRPSSFSSPYLPSLSSLQQKKIHATAAALHDEATLESSNTVGGTSIHPEDETQPDSVSTFIGNHSGMQRRKTPTSRYNLKFFGGKNSEEGLSLVGEGLANTQREREKDRDRDVGAAKVQSHSARPAQKSRNGREKQVWNTYSSSTSVSDGALRSAVLS